MKILVDAERGGYHGTALLTEGTTHHNSSNERHVRAVVTTPLGSDEVFDWTNGLETIDNAESLRKWIKETFLCDC